MKTRINEELKELFTAEDARLQSLLFEKDTTRMPAGLIVEQKYSLVRRHGRDTGEAYELKTSKNIWKVEERTIKKARVDRIENGKVFLSLDAFSPEEWEVLKECGVEKSATIKVILVGKGSMGSTECTLDKEDNSIVPDFLNAETTYSLQAYVECKGRASAKSEATEFITPMFSECCAWKRCPEYVVWHRQYSTGRANPRVVRTLSPSYGVSEHYNIIGNTALPQNKVTSWNIKILKSLGNDGDGIYIGVAPFDIDQNEDFNKCGWYFSCYTSTLWSGPPHSYNGKEYGPRKGDGQYVHTGDSVGVVMDTAKTKSELLFVVNGVSLGVAYDVIPLDKPLVPCAMFWYGSDCVELDTSGVKAMAHSSSDTSFCVVV